MPTGTLPESGKKLWEEVHKKALEGSCKDAKDPEACAAGSAWTAVKNAGWYKDSSGQWKKKAELTEFSLTIVKASYDKATNTMRWLASASDVHDDSYGDNMTPELFSDFLSRIEANEPAPEDFRSDFWQGGMPYLSVSHYPDFDGSAVPGDVEVVYVDGDYLKARGTYHDTPIGRACWKAINYDLYNAERSEAEDRVRISIAFLDWKHRHKSNGYLFERKSLSDLCPECFRELFSGEHTGVEFLAGQLVHLAHTRVPINRRTLMEVDKAMTTKKEDAASIIGDELANELDEKEKNRLVGKSEAMVIKSDDDTEIPEPIVEEAKTKKDMPMEDEEDETEDEEDCKTKKKKTMKAELEEIRSLIAGMKSEFVEVKAIFAPTPKENHPLHDAIEKFKSDYDDAVKMSDINPDDKLRLVQQSFDALGQRVIETMKTPTTPQEPNPINDMAKAFSEALQPLMQEMSLLNARLSNLEQLKVTQPTNQPAPPVVPQRRSAAPTLQMQSNLRQGISPGVARSETPHLRAVIERTT